MKAKNFISLMLAAAIICTATSCQKGNTGNNGNKENGGTTMNPIVNIAPPTLEPQPEIEDKGELIKYTISKTISSDMVVQRNSYFNVFGWSKNKGGVIYGEFMGEKRYGIIDDSGKWSIKFSSHEATAEPQTLKIYPKNGKTTEFKDILVGDVWMVSGQSNAELNLSFALTKTPEYKKEIKKEDNIRLFTQTREHVMSIKDKVDLTKPQEDVVNSKWKWKKASLSNASVFSALGYYFAKELSRTVDVPIGVVMAAAGGAVLHELMPADVATECGLTSAPSVPVCGFYNSLLYPFTNNSITGMIFYQGESESNAGQYKNYSANLQKTVAAYRKIWGLDFPFINVQLTTHMGESLTGWYELDKIRAAQYDAYKAMGNSFFVVSRDQGFQTGDPDWAHPYYKLELGKRAASIAAAVIYQKADINYSTSPEPAKITWKKDSVTIDFNYVGDGLKLLVGEELTGFSVLDADGNRVIKSAELIDKDTVKLTTSSEGKTVCYCMFPEGTAEKANLGNSIGYPAPAFELSK